MRCPFCGKNDSKVIDSRETGEGEQIRRRRECQACEARFTTYEIVEVNLPRIVKRDGARESFNEEKLRIGIQKALEKRPVDSNRIDTILMDVKKHLMACGEREVKSREIGEWMMEALKAVDKIAYIRFASVYRSFQDLSEFREVIERLESTTQLK